MQGLVFPDEAPSTWTMPIVWAPVGKLLHWNLLMS